MVILDRKRTYCGPRSDDVALAKAPVFGKIANDPPTCGAIAAPYRFDGMNCAQEWLAILRIDPVFDLDQDRTVVRQRLDRDGHVR